MLLEFKTKNYKSFVEEASFSMVAAPKQKGLDYSLMKTKIKLSWPHAPEGCNGTNKGLVHAAWDGLDRKSVV